MKTNSIPICRSKPSEDGYMLIAVIFMLAILMISMSVAAPVVKKEIQRDRELETMHRGKQYIRAVKLYYKQFGAYPPNLDALVNTNQVRFLRKKYIDPTTGKEEWKVIHFGEQKTQSVGFFGQPIGGPVAPVAGTGQAGGIGSAGGSIGGASGIGGGLFSGSASGSTDSGSGAAQAGAANSGAAGGSTDSSSGTSSSGTGSSGTGFGSSGSTYSNGASGGSATGTGSTGQTLGGGGIIGVSPNSPKQSIWVYRKKNHYNEWEFIYDPLADQMLVGGNTGTIGQPASSTTTPVGGSGIGGGTGIGGGAGFGSPGGGFNSGGSNSGGAAPTPAQPPPQQ